jgi:hypothetical protein
MAADRALASRLPEDCARSVLTLLAVKDIPAAAACSRAWCAAARTSELWMALVSTRWPATASGTLRQAVLRRGPREYYRQQAAVLRTHTPRRPPLELDDLLVQLDLTQNGRTICSVAREARDVLRRDCEDIGSRLQDGIIFDNLHARVDTSKDNLFPPEEAPVSISYSVIRKSDGRVAALVPTAELEFKCGWALGDGFAANPSLRGYLPAEYAQPTLLDGDPQDVSTSWLLGRTNGNMCRTVAVVHIGTRREFPYNSGPWVPSPDPSVVAGEGYVELRRILVAFAFHLEERLEDHERDDEFDDGVRVMDSHDLNLDELRLAFDQRLVFR